MKAAADEILGGAQESKNDCMPFLDSLIVELVHRLGEIEEKMRRRLGTVE